MKHPIWGAVMLAALASASAQAEPLSLDDAINRALNAAPENIVSAAAIDAARAARVQAAIRPGGEVTIEAENTIGSGVYSRFNQAEITSSYSQPIERGGRRAARIALAERDIALAEANGTTRRLDVAAAVERAFIDVLIADAIVQIATARLSQEQAIRAEALRRVRGYKDPLFVETAANGRVREAELALDEARAGAVAARAMLASFWGGDGNTIVVEGDLLRRDGMVTNLAVADNQLAEAELARARAAIAQERALAHNDYRWSAGARYLRDSNDVALVAGITIPIGGNRNRGNIAQAEAQARQIAAEQAADMATRQRRLDYLLAAAEAARTRANRLASEIYPINTRTLEQVREGYNRGGFTFQNIMDAADAIAATQADWLAAITRYRDLLTEIDRLTGRFAALAAPQVQENLP
ncbi:MAG: TolC family protein [Sphingomonadaceae bacterium]|nr:TolC family protein [Sphingomonadaceae bacterium]